MDKKFIRSNWSSSHKSMEGLFDILESFENRLSAIEKRTEASNLDSFLEKMRSDINIIALSTTQEKEESLND